MKRIIILLIGTILFFTSCQEKTINLEDVRIKDNLVYYKEESKSFSGIVKLKTSNPMEFSNKEALDFLVAKNFSDITKIFDFPIYEKLNNVRNDNKSKNLNILLIRSFYLNFLSEVLIGAIYMNYFNIYLLKDIESIIEVKNGKINGKTKFYKENSLFFETIYSENFIQESKLFHSNGKLMAEEKFQNGNIIKSKIFTYDNVDNLILETTLDDSEGKLKTILVFFKNNKKVQEIFFSLDDCLIKIYEDGKLIKEGILDKNNSILKEHKDGNLISEETKKSMEILGMFKIPNTINYKREDKIE